MQFLAKKNRFQNIEWHSTLSGLHIGCTEYRRVAGKKIQQDSVRPAESDLRLVFSAPTRRARVNSVIFLVQIASRLPRLVRGADPQLRQIQSELFGKVNVCVDKCSDHHVLQWGPSVREIPLLPS